MHTIYGAANGFVNERYKWFLLLWLAAKMGSLGNSLKMALSLSSSTTGSAIPALSYSMGKGGSPK
jgi:hypothetical protein